MMVIAAVLLMIGVFLFGAMGQLAGGATEAASSAPSGKTEYLRLDFAGVLEGAGCPCVAPGNTQADQDAKCATCEESNYGPCSPPDCGAPECGGGTAPPCLDCSLCTTCGPENHTAVTTSVLRQCVFSQGVTVLDPFQVIAKVTAVFFDDTAYAWVNYAASLERASFAVVNSDPGNVATFEQSIFSGQNTTVLPKQPGFGPPTDGPQLFYSTAVFGPLDWSLLGPRFGKTTSVGFRICTIATATTPSVCTNYPCTFGVDKPVLLPSDVGL